MVIPLLFSLSLLLLIHYLWGTSLLHKKLPSPIYQTPPTIPENCQAQRLPIGQAQVLLITKGPQNQHTPSVIFVPGFAEDFRYGLLGLHQWLHNSPSARLTILLKRGYANPFPEPLFPLLQNTPWTLEDKDDSFTIDQDAHVVRTLIQHDPSNHITLWGHSQGGATAQAALTTIDQHSNPTLNQQIMPRLSALVLEAAVLPGGKLAPIPALIPFRSLAHCILPHLWIGNKLDFVLLHSVRRTLKKSKLPDLQHRLEIIDRCLYRFLKPHVALENAWSLKSFMKQHQRQIILKELAKHQKLFGLFPISKDLILHTQQNLRILQECAPQLLGDDPLKHTLITCPQSHFVTIERPDLGLLLLQKIYPTKKHSQTPKEPITNL